MRQYYQNTELPYTSDRLIGGDMRPIYVCEEPFYRYRRYLQQLDRRPMSENDFYILVQNVKKASVDSYYLEAIVNFCEK